MFHSVVFNVTVLWNNFFEEAAQSRNVPLVMSQLIDELANSIFGRDLKSTNKSSIGFRNTQILVQHEERLSDRYDHCISKPVTVIGRNSLRTAPRTPY